MKKSILCVMAILLICSFAVSVFATQNDQTPIMPRYTYISTTIVNLSIDKTTNVTTSYAHCHTYDDYEIQVTCQLQRYNNSKWNTIKTWTKSGIGYVDFEKNWAVPSGYTYRAYVTFKVYDSNGNVVESVSRYDSENFPSP